MAYTWTTLTAAKTTTGSIQNLVNRGDLPTENILLKAEALIYGKLRVREMMAQTDLSLTASATSYKVSLPSGFLDPIKLVPFGWGTPLDYRHEGNFSIYRDAAGDRQESTEPGIWTVIGSEIHFDSLLTENWGGELLYYKQPDALSNSNQTNFLTSRYPHILEHACLAFAYEHMKDPERTLEYRQKAEAEIAEANMDNEMWRRGQF